MSANNNLISFQNLTVTYQSSTGQTIGVKNVTFDIKEGDFCAIVGNNGSGKTSLIKALLGLVPCSEGRIDCALKGDEIAYLPQINAIPLDFPADVFEIVATGTLKNDKLFPFYTKADVQSAKDAIKQIGIESLEKTMFGALSGGQRQRVLLARAMCRNPKLLILDEPINGLDAEITEQFYNILKELNSKNVTILMVTHDLSNVSDTAKTVVYMNQTLKFQGTVKKWQEMLLNKEEIF